MHRRVASKLHSRTRQLFWGQVFSDVTEVRKSDASVKVSPDVEVVTRMSVGLILSAQSPINCYHTVDGKNVRCDCTQVSTREWCLSDRAVDLQAVGKLILNDSTQQYQNFLITSGNNYETSLILGGVGGMVARELLESKK